MARRIREDPTGERVIIPVDPVNEVAIIAAAIRDTDLLDKLLRRLMPDQFMLRENREAWAALGEVRRKGLELDRASVIAVAGEHVADYLTSIAAVSEEPSKANVEWHVQNLLWDNARATAARGPVQSFLEALRDPRADKDKVLGFARQIGAAFEGHADRRYIRDPRELVREAMKDVEARVAGHAHYPYGIPGLDYHDPIRRDKKRMIPGTEPGQLTCLTASSGNGKSLTAAWMAMGIAFPGGIESDAVGRRVGYGAWEVRSKMTIQVLACLSLGWSRTDLMDPQGNPDGPVHTHENRVLLEERMHRLSQRITFVDIPFSRHAGEKTSNEKNLDTLQGIIADLGCEVIIADLWRRILAGDKGRTPDAEEAALERQQAMNEELQIHMIALQQQRLADVEAGADKRPTRGGVKGSKIWVEAPDTFIGMFRPGLYKRIPDVKIQALILKQRHGVFPCAAEFDFDAEHGQIRGGKPIPYESPGEMSEFDASADFTGPPIGRRRRN